MLQDISSLGHQDSFTCEEDVIAALALWWGIDYELIFYNSWGFYYYPLKVNQGAKLGTRIRNGDYDAFVNLKKFYGINSKMMYRECKEKQWGTLLSELALNCPVCIVMDPFYAYWTDRYKYLHGNHSFLAVGFDKDSDSVNCVDPSFNLDRSIKILSRSDFVNGNGLCRLVSRGEQEDLNINWREFLGDIVSKQHGLVEGKNIFESIREFARDMKQNMDMELEIQGHEEFSYYAPIFVQLWIIAYGRKKFGKMLEYLGRTFTVNRLFEESEALGEIKERWMGVIFELLELLKPCSDFDSKSIINSASEKIMQLAFDEEAISNNLLKLCKSA
ncbi:MAG: BtrH N-terminal domain-containing protein [Bacillota bacterium]|nr:BtrH N-terminal domain-containing protein [Bacillota bacterium]